MDIRIHFLLYLCFFLSFTNGLKTKTEDHPTLLLGNRESIQLMEVLRPHNVKTIMDDIDYTAACDYIFDDHLIFWMDSASDQGKIQCTYTNVTYENRVKKDVIRSGLVKPEGLACDWISKKLYWTDAEPNRIEVSDIEGKTRKVLIWDRLDEPRAIAVDPLNGYMYWTDWGEDPKIERAGMDGSDRKVLVERDGIYWPNGLTIDYNEQKIYWVDANYHYINRMNTDGTAREVVVSSGPTNAGENTGNHDGVQGGALQHPFAITLSGNNIYWTDWATNSIHSAAKNGVHSPAHNGSGKTKVVKENISSLHDIHSYGAHRQKKGRNPCGRNNGGCSHLCLISPSPPYFTCACPTGVQIKPDGQTCKDGPDSILILARHADMRVMSLDTPDFTDIILPLQNVKMAVAVEYDPVDDMVYWSNNVKNTGKIYRAKLNGQDEQLIVSQEIEQCDGLAVDWVGRNLYWAEARRSYIGVSRLNGTSRKTLIEKGVKFPRAIVLDPAKGQMYWSDWGDNPKIERASLDGSDRVVFVNTSLRWPNGLAIDYEKRLLYWAEAHLDKIEVIGLNGTGRRAILEGRIPHIFGFSLLDDYIYWSDWEKRKVERMLVYDKHSRHSLIDELPNLMGIKASKVNPIPATNPCARNNGGCSHLCLYTPGGATCHCPDGQELLDDLKSCIEPEAFLLFTLASQGVGRISLETAPRHNTEVPFDNMVDATHLDVSVQDDSIFWTDIDRMQIFRSYMNGTAVQPIIDQGLNMLEGIAIDWLGKSIYWADSMTNRIEMAKLDGTNRLPVVWQGLETPLSVAVDPINGYIYWSEWGGPKPKIRRSEMDGSNIQTLVGDGEIGRANSLTLDYEKNRLYWVDLDANEIVSSNLTGGDRRQIISGSKETVFTMTLYKEYIYWTKSRSIERANKTNGENRVLIQSSSEVDSHLSIHDMLVSHTSRQMGVTACSHDNGGCEHICLTVPGGTHKCACPAHYQLRPDNHTCSAPKDFILFSQEEYISRLIVEKGTSGKQTPDAILPIRGIYRACAIDYDPLKDFVFWIDCDLGEIKKSRMNGTETSTLLENLDNLHHPHDLAVDPYGRKLYWTDSKNNSISVMELDGTIIGAVAKDKVKLVGTGNQNEERKIMPRKIALYPHNGYLFVSSVCSDRDTSCRSMILRMSLDGSNCLILFSSGLKKISGLTVDQDESKLYWADEEMKKIERSDLDGGSRSPFTDANLIQPSGVTVLGSNVYWFDKKADGWQIEANRKVGGHPKIIQGRIKNILYIVGVVDIRPRDIADHPCAKDRDYCSHLCIGKEDNTMECSCPMHLTLSTEKDCDTAPTCKPSEFTCVAGDIPCIPRTWVCDGTKDCTDSSDEAHCPSCPAPSYMCGTGVGGTEEETARATSQLSEFLGYVSDAKMDQCIPIKLRCDGTPDCLDGSDEMGCYNPCDGLFVCDGQKCISQSRKCDGKNDCDDRTDESMCDPSELPTAAHDYTLIIIVVIVALVVISVFTVVICFRKRKSKKQHYARPTVTFTSDGVDGFRLNLEVTSPSDHMTHVKAASNPLKSTKKGKGRSTSLNLSFVPPKVGGPTHMVNARMPMGHDRPMVQGAIAPCGPVPYPSSYNVNDHVRPNIPGASSSSSSSRINKFLPTLNPPPSPATDRSGSKSMGECQYSSDSQSNRTGSYYRCRNGHRHRRSHHHHPIMQAPPPPTPCTSDACDDFMSYHSGASSREFDTISRRSKSGGAPSSPPPPYCSCYYHCYHPYMGYGAGYPPFHPTTSYHSSRHGYHTPPIGRGDHVHHSSSSSGSTHMPLHECYGPCCHGGSGRHHHSSSGRSSRGPHHHPPRYNVMSSDVNSDSDPFAPPPTPRSYYMSDCCYTHDEADDNQDDETGSDPTRYINEMAERPPKERESPKGERKETEPLLTYSEARAAETPPGEQISENPENESPTKLETSEPVKKKLTGADEEGKEGGERVALLSSEQSRPGSPNTEHSYRIFNPPPSPVTDSS